MNAEKRTEERHDLMTSQEAKQAFLRAGLSEATFHRRVNAGLIESVLPEGRQRGAMYPREQVLAAVESKIRKSRKKKSTINLKPTTFSKATVQDIPEIATLLKTFFSRISIEKRAAWLERNPEIAYILRSEGKVVGCAFILPLEEQKITQILNAPIKPPTRPQDIGIYEPGKHYCLYIRSVVVLQSVPKPQRKHWAARLISELIREIIEMGARGVIIDKVYAQTDTRRVEHLLKLLGFTQAMSVTESKNFVLDIATSGSVFATQYRKALNRWLEE
ncbi:MAG TPA: GNAT family N-acetyltransferase [Ktedonobacteraceae bacterium]|jgi:N-acetylglutamate synthase-like GNAT family acetyltransferase